MAIKKTSINIDSLIEKYEVESVRQNNLLYLKVLKDFIEIVGYQKILTFLGCTPLLLEDAEFARGNMMRILNYFFSDPKNEQYLSDLYLLLEKYGYRLENELQRAFYNIGEFGEYGFKNLAHSPVIRSINKQIKDNNIIYIIDSKWGKIIVKQAYNYFDSSISSYYFPLMSLNQGNRKDCHRMTQYFVLEFPGSHQAYTSLCSDAFKGGYFHSYAYCPSKDEVIDFNKKIILRLEDFNNFFSPEVIKITKGEDLQKELATLKLEKRLKYEPLLELALQKL